MRINAAIKIAPKKTFVQIIFVGKIKIKKKNRFLQKNIFYIFEFWKLLFICLHQIRVNKMKQKNPKIDSTSKPNVHLQPKTFY